MPDPRAELTRYMERRQEWLDDNWDKIAVRGGVAPRTLLEVRTGTRAIMRKTRRGIEAGLFWPRGLVDDILNRKRLTVDPETVDPVAATQTTKLKKLDNKSVTEIADALERLSGVPHDEFEARLARGDFTDEQREAIEDLLRLFSEGRQGEQQAQ